MYSDISSLILGLLIVWTIIGAIKVIAAIIEVILDFLEGNDRV